MIRYRACSQSSGEGKMWYKLEESEKASWRKWWLRWVSVDITVLKSLARVFQAEKNLCKGGERGFRECDLIKGVANCLGHMRLSQESVGRETRRWGWKESEQELQIEGYCGLLMVWDEEPRMVFNRVGLRLNLHGFIYISENFHFSFTFSFCRLSYNCEQNTLVNHI